MDVKLEEALTEEMRLVLDDLVGSATACEWCAECCVDGGPEMAECVRLCRDVADLATLSVRLLARDSVFGPEAIEVFVDAAETCARECARHGHRHCQACAEELSRAVQSTRKMLASFDREGGSATGRAHSGRRGQPFDRPGNQAYSDPPGRQTRLPVEGGGQRGWPDEPRRADDEPWGHSSGRGRELEYGSGRRRESDREPGRADDRDPWRAYERGLEREYGRNPEGEFDRRRDRAYDRREYDRRREREFGPGRSDG